MECRHGPRHACRGVTYIEACLALGVSSLLLALALPSLGQLRQQMQLRARAEQLASDLRLARAEAVRLAEPVHFRISGKGSEACYLLHRGPLNGCECAAGAARCTQPGGAILKTEWLPPGQPVRITSNAETLTFQFSQGLVTQTGSVDLRLSSGEAIRQVVAITGRVRSCYIGRAVVNMPRCA